MTTETPPAPGRHGARRGRGVLRGAALLAVVVAWLAIAGLGGPAIGALSSVQSNDQESFLPANAESVEAAEAARAFSDRPSLPAFVVFSVGGTADTDGLPASPEQLTSWNAFAGSVAAIEVEGVGTVGQFLVGGAAAPLVPSEDGQAALLVLPLDSDLVSTADASGEPPLDRIVDEVRAAAVAAAAGASAHVAGPAGLVSDLGAAFAGIDGVLLLVALSAVLVILILIYRAIALPLVVLFTSVSGLALAGGVVYLLAREDVLVLNGQSQGILFILTVGAATDYGLLLVSRYREELTRVTSTATAMRRAWRSCLEPVAASAGTVIIGLLCLLLSDLNSNRSLGPVGAIGIVAAFLAALTLLPALLLAGRWLFWPRIPHPPATARSAEGRHATDAARPHTAQHERPARRGIWVVIADVVGRHPRRTWLITAGALAVACLAVPTFKASGTPQTDVFLTDVDSIDGQEALVDHFPGGSGDPVVVIAPEAAGDAVVETLSSTPGVTAAGLVGEGGRPGGPPLVVDGRVQVQATLTDAADSQAAEDTIRAARAALHALSDGEQILVGGTTATQYDTVTTAEHDLRLIIPVILVAVLLVLIVLLRSLVAPLILIVATVLSFGAAMGVGALVFNHWWDFPGADPAVPLFAFVFLVALGVDYSIFLMTRVREEVAVHGPNEGVLRGLRVTGGVITSAGVVLAATFAALFVIPILFLAQIAFLVTFGVLLDTLVVRTLLVPALASDLGRRTWWPVTPKPTRHQREVARMQ
ncbi:MMPL family transporter [Nakamurella leprariae]|uniref:MMPL family transporter n=1 Tax=Nakamurella leprariae TaxID=2803911 RepID=A0A939C0B8_9ACTN|nr:MMPL family transporter [Nakamurella leprariae]MBM9469060.1 MMPL family transporter [Nakamurella leprariae]